MKCTIGNSLDTCEYFDNPKIGYVVPQKLFGKDSNAKTKKGIPLGYSTYLIYLAPAKQNKFGKNLCSGATEGCMSSCLFTAGRGRMKPVEKARKNKAEYFLSDRDGFMTQVYKEIDTAYKSSLKNGIPIAIRMNGTSDIPWENILVTAPNGKRYTNIMAAFPKVQFYDYTKIYRRLGNTPENYHLTFSRAETMQSKIEAEEALKRGFQVAAVFATKKGQDLPTNYKGYKVVDGDEHDLTFLRPKGVILGLRAKGSANKDTSGFVIQDADIKKISGNNISKQDIEDFIKWMSDSVSYNGIYYSTQDAQYKNKLTQEGLIEYYFKEFIGMKLKKGSAEAKAYMAALRARKNDNVGAYKRKTLTKTQKEENKDIDKYNWFVVSNDGYVSSGWEYKSDAIDQMNENNEYPYMGKNWKVISLRTLKQMGLEDPRENWKNKVGALERINKRKNTTYIHLTRKPLKRKKIAVKKATRPKQTTTLMPLSNLQFEDTYTLGKSGKTIYTRGYKLPNKDAYEATTLSGKRVVHKGSVKVNLIDERGVSGYVHTKRKGTKTTIKYTRTKKVSGVDTKSKLHTDFNLPEVNIQVGMSENNLDLIRKYNRSISVLSDRILDIQAQKRYFEPMAKKQAEKGIAYLKRNIASYKKQIAELKKNI